MKPSQSGLTNAFMKFLLKETKKSVSGVVKVAWENGAAQAEKASAEQIGALKAEIASLKALIARGMADE